MRNPGDTVAQIASGVVPVISLGNYDVVSAEPRTNRGYADGFALAATAVEWCGAYIQSLGDNGIVVQRVSVIAPTAGGALMSWAAAPSRPWAGGSVRVMTPLTPELPVLSSHVDIENQPLPAPTGAALGGWDVPGTVPGGKQLPPFDMVPEGVWIPAGWFVWFTKRNSVAPNNISTAWTFRELTGTPGGY